MKFIPFICLLFSPFLYFAQVNEIGNDFSIDYSAPKEFEIGAIRIEGADNFDHQSIKLIAGLRQGTRITIPGNAITEAITNLWKENLFTNVEVAVEREIKGVVYLVIKLTPRPKLSRFRFDGVTKKDADKIREIINLFSGKTISENLMLSTQLKIKGYYREKGYYGVKVDITQEPDHLMNNAALFNIKVIRSN